jgi:hypothetical protein
MRQRRSESSMKLEFTCWTLIHHKEGVEIVDDVPVLYPTRRDACSASCGGWLGSKPVRVRVIVETPRSSPVLSSVDLSSRSRGN